jgi:hypothetical protein
LKAGGICNRQPPCATDTRANHTNDPWSTSEVGRAWAKHDLSFLPKSTDVTLANAAEFVAKRPNKG